VAMAGLRVRELGKPDAVDADTVFPLASVSKPVGSTVIATLTGEGGVVQWDDPVTKYEPSFALGDAWVTQHVTLADLYSHRTGLPDHAGDFVEDLGYDRDTVIARLRFAPLASFRASYAYTNFGLTVAALAAAKAAGKDWNDLSAERLYGPLGMASTSSRYADFLTRPNRVAPHVRKDGVWSVNPSPRQPDAQTPAGGVSSSVRDMSRFVRLHLGQGTVDGVKVVDAAQLARTHRPEVRSSEPRVWDGRAGFYGLGWNVGQNEHGQTTWSHSGGFALGAATVVSLMPTEQLGIVVLTNGMPIGFPEAMTDVFFDFVGAGKPLRDWVALRAQQLAPVVDGPPKEHDYATRPANAAAPRAADAYVGTYGNDFYGSLTVAANGNDLSVSFGSIAKSYPLAPYDGDLFTWTAPGENGTGLRGVTFAVGGDGKATSVRIEDYDVEKNGTFARQ
jgi:CubicO group peptidase (beta-lactamase class C family)